MESTQPLPLCSHSALSQAVSYLTLETLLSHAVQSWLTQNSCLKTLQISTSKKKYSAKTFWSSLFQHLHRMCTLQNESHVSLTGYFTIQFSTGLPSAGPLYPSLFAALNTWRKERLNLYMPHFPSSMPTCYCERQTLTRGTSGLSSEIPDLMRQRGEIWAEVTMIHKHLLYYWAGNRCIILILPDTFALKMVNLILASSNSPSCMLWGTNVFFSHKGIPSRC